MGAQMNTREIGKQIARDTADADSFDVLSPFARDIVGAASAQLRIPMLDSVRTIGAMRLIVRDFERLILNVDKMPDERAKLFALSGAVRDLNKRINCFRFKGRAR